jgi:hypothetical protein
MLERGRLTFVSNITPLLGLLCMYGEVDLELSVSSSWTRKRLHTNTTVGIGGADEARE